MSKNSLTEGKIFPSLLGFAAPVFLAMFLQALYGGVDLLVVGQFAETGDVSGVATGSLIMQTFTSIITGLAMGITVLVGRRIGEENPEEAGRAVGGGIALFSVFALLFTVLIPLFSDQLAHMMHAPEEAFRETSDYIKICGIGSVFIIAYNVLGSIFRGIGDAKTPLITVAIAAVANVIGDIILVAGFDMGAAGAAIATVAAQGVSVVMSLILIRKKKLPFDFSIKSIRFEQDIIGAELRLGVPIALQDLLVGISFLIIQMIVNSIDVISSAAVGIGDKVCAFLLLIPAAYMQAMSAFVAQNLGARKPERARAALKCSIISALVVGMLMAYLAIFHGDMLARIFDTDSVVVERAHLYLAAYGFDCILTPFLFCFIGYYNGCGNTTFVMLQGIFGAFAVRVPVVYLMSSLQNTNLFLIGISTPISTVFQIILCLAVFGHLEKKRMMKESEAK